MGGRPAFAVELEECEHSDDEADHNIEKLRQIGCTVHEVTDREIEIVEFTEEELEFLAQLEHGRWNVERLSTGWKWGATKDEARKISPYLIPWEELPEHVKEWDRKAVRAIPEVLREAKMEIRRQEPPATGRRRSP